MTLSLLAALTRRDDKEECFGTFVCCSIVIELTAWLALDTCLL